MKRWWFQGFKRKKVWKLVENNWISGFCKTKDKYNSNFEHLDQEDCWLADAYVETDYSQLTEKHFEKTIRDYLAFRISILEEENE